MGERGGKRGDDSLGLPERVRGEHRRFPSQMRRAIWLSCVFFRIHLLTNYTVITIIQITKRDGEDARGLQAGSPLLGVVRWRVE